MKNGLEYPVTLNALQKELLKHSKDGRSDALFRHAIAIDQIGGLVRFLTHDQKENPSSRPHGNRKGEIAAAGNAIVQLCTYVALRDINLQEAVNACLDNLRSKDFIRVEDKSIATNLKGMWVCDGCEPVLGFAFVDPTLENIDNMPLGSVLVAEHPTDDLSRYQSRCKAIITDQGGFSCHAATIARENNITCMVGTGNATKVIKTGNIVFLDPKNGIAGVKS